MCGSCQRQPQDKIRFKGEKIYVHPISNHRTALGGVITSGGGVITSGGGVNQLTSGATDCSGKKSGA